MIQNSRDLDFEYMEPTPHHTADTGQLISRVQENVRNDTQIADTPARPRRTREVSPIQLPTTPDDTLPRRSARLTEADIPRLSLPSDSDSETEGDRALIAIPEDAPAQREVDSILMVVPRKELLSSDFYIPWSYQDAITCPDAPKWVKAIEREASCITEANALKPALVGRDTKVIGYTWVFTVKIVDNNPVYKARIVAQGCYQPKATDE